jgi:hypothetical protein
MPETVQHTIPMETEKTDLLSGKVRAEVVDALAQLLLLVSVLVAEEEVGDDA